MSVGKINKRNRKAERRMAEQLVYVRYPRQVKRRKGYSFEKDDAVSRRINDIVRKVDLFD